MSGYQVDVEMCVIAKLEETEEYKAVEELYLEFQNFYVLEISLLGKSFVNIQYHIALIFLYDTKD